MSVTGDPAVDPAVRSLLEQVRDSFPERFAATAELLEEEGLDADTIAAFATQVISPAAPDEMLDRGIPTLQPDVCRVPTPQLTERFRFAGTWEEAGLRWLGLADMEAALADPAIGVHFRSHRDHWEGSAPAMFPTDRLSLFAVVDDQPEDQSYLVWPSIEGGAPPEPEVWTYSGHSEQRFPDLRRYLEWVLTD